MPHRAQSKPLLCAAYFFAILFSIATIATPARAQQEQAPKTNQVIRSQTQLVNLFVTVRDKHHAILTNLTKDDFHVFEDNTEQKIAYFSNDVNQPITLGLLLDTSGSEMEMLPAIQDTAISFLQDVLHKGDEAMVLSFDTDVDLLADFTDDQSLLDHAIRRTRINAPQESGPFGGQNIVGTAFYDAVYLAAHDQLAGQAGRKAIVVVTDANDEGSKESMQDAIDAAQRADAVIHILLVYDPQWGGNTGVANKMTEETGGRLIIVRGTKDLEKAFTTISDELRHQYVLGYYPTNTAHDGSFRKIRVEVTRPDTKVLARKGYFAPSN